MPHVVMVDTFGPGGIKCLDAALRRDYRTTFIASPNRDNKYLNPMTNAILARVHRQLSLDDTTDEAALEAALRALHAEEPIDAVFTTLHPVVVPLARAAERLGLRFTRRIGVERGAIKHLARARLDACGVPSARFAVIHDPVDLGSAVAHVGFPMVVKPSGGVGKLFTTIVRDVGELEAAVAGFFAERAAAPTLYQRGLEAGLVLEQYLRGRMLSVEVAAVSDQIEVIGIEDRRRSSENEVLELGTTVPARLDPDQRRVVGDYAIAVVRALELDLGIFHIELMLTADGPRLIEANPRIHGAPRAMSISTGIDLHDLLVEVHLGKPLALPPRADTPVALLVVMTTRAETLPETIDLKWTETLRPRLIDCGVHRKPGEALAAPRGNRDAFATALMTAPTREAVDGLAEEVLERLSQAVGFPLARGHSGST